MKQFRVVEFYSGIGGLHLALRDIPNIQFTVASAYDINTSANTVYRHNFPEATLHPRNIQSVTSDELDKLAANFFLLSPPCQPFTRQGKRLDTADRRTNSFLHLLDVFSKLTHPPEFILLENVKGFEESEAHRLLLEYLRSAGYSHKEFLLSPMQFGVPNSRLRYYLLARSHTTKHDWPESFKEICTEWPTSNIDTSVARLSAFLRSPAADSSAYLLNDKTLAKYGEILDIVTYSDRRSCCFTKGYGHYVEGTGSVIQGSEETSLNSAFSDYRVAATDVEKASSLHPLNLRYFTPREIANLMCFPASFEFPPDLSRKQQYRLIGNSVNVHVVKQLVKLLLDGVHQPT